MGKGDIARYEQFLLFCHSVFKRFLLMTRKNSLLLSNTYRSPYRYVAKRMVASVINFSEVMSYYIRGIIFGLEPRLNENGPEGHFTKLCTHGICERESLRRASGRNTRLTKLGPYLVVARCTPYNVCHRFLRQAVHHIMQHQGVACREVRHISRTFQTGWQRKGVATCSLIG